MPKNTFFNLPKEKRTRIIDGAKKVFSKHHYRKVTIDAIVTEAGIPKGSFYQYFQNKDDLFMYLFSEIGVEKKLVLDQVIEKSKNLNFAELIIKLIDMANNFENKDEVMIGLKDKFLKQCPQEIKNKILSDLIPDTMNMFNRVITRYVQLGHFRADLNIKKASFVLTSVVINIDKFELGNESDYGEVLFDITRLLEKGLSK